MASIRKTFSFRNGVQVDEDNFIVNANGLVGIGTSIPSESLDVRGTAKVVGLTTTNDLFVSGVATAIDIKVGTAISITGGGVKAANFYGDGATLSNLPTSQWEDVDVGLGFTSIYAIGNVGIVTVDPRQSFQVGGSPDIIGKSGVGINSIGNIKATGIVTATSFVGALTGDVTGNVTGAITGNVTGNITGNIDGDVNSTGVSTFTTLDVNGNVDIDGHTELDDLNVSGVATATSFVGAVTGDVTGNVTGNLTGNVTGNITGDINSGITTASTELNVGTGGTAFTSTNLGRVGIGSVIPKTDLTIRKENSASLEIIGESGTTKVSIGQSETDGNESALIRYGNPDASLNIINYNAGSVNSFIHAGSGTGIQTGRFSWIYGQSNQEILSLTHGGSLGLGKTNPDHTLHVVGTSTVTSDAYVGNDLFVGDDATINGNLTVSGVVDLPPVIDGTNINTLTGISTVKEVSIGGSITFLPGNININGFGTNFGAKSSVSSLGIGVSVAGITTTSDSLTLKVLGSSEFEYVGIGTTASPAENMGGVGYGVDSGGTDTSNGLHLFNCKVGINSSSVYIRRTDISTSGEVTLSVGSTNTKAIIDFSDAGKGDGSALNPGISTARYMLPPIVTTAERTGLTTSAGGIVYNSTLNKLQCFDGTTWNNLF